MNLDQYREMKAQESATPNEEQTNVQTNENTVIPTEQIQSAEAETNPIPNEADAQTPAQEEPITSTPTTIEIDGQEIPVEELKNGYLRQSDYTRKTQELARTKKELENAERVYQAMHKDAETAQEISERLGIDYVSPEQEKVQAMQAKYEELVIERDIEKLQAKYGEFDVRTVLQTAYDKQLNSLEDAYILVQSRQQAEQRATPSLDIEAIKEQIRQELKQELQSTVDTSSLISASSGGKQITDDTPQLSPAELRVAQAMKISPAEYARHKNRK